MHFEGVEWFVACCAMTLGHEGNVHVYKPRPARLEDANIGLVFMLYVLHAASPRRC